MRFYFYLTAITWSRVTHEKPSRAWIPQPVEPLRALSDSIKAILVNMVKDWIITGYDPPWITIEKIKSTSS